MVDFTLGKQQALTKEQRDTSLSSATFQIDNGEKANFSELAGITSELETVEYMEASAQGPVFGRLFGKAKPPTVTLKRAMGNNDDTKWIWAWHAQARLGDTSAFKDTTLTLFGAGAPDTPIKAYMLTNAIPTKVEIGGIKAGATEVAIQTLTLQCDNIEEAP
jgi:phage tail-like protein